MPAIELPKELSKSHWDKKKGALPAGSPLETQLKAFEKKHAAVDWSLFEAGWEKKAKNAAALDDAHAAADRAYRTKVLALKAESNGVADAAQKLLKEKGLAKPTLDAVKEITDAVKSFGKAVDAGLDDLEKTHVKAAAAFKSEAAGAAGESDDENEPPSALLDPKRLLAQLQLCKRMPERRVAFALVGDGKSDPVLSLAPKLTGPRLFAKLKEGTGMKAGSYGRAWIADKVLYLEMDKPLSGLVKKARAALKQAGFKVSKIVLAGEDGSVLESDEEAEDAVGAGAETGAETGAERGAETGATAPPLPPAEEPAAARGPAPAPASATGTQVVFTQTRLVWEQTRKKVQSELRKLEAAILEASKDEPDAAEIAAGTRNLYEVLDYLDERLIDKLDEALNATSADDRRARHDEARDIVGEYVDFIGSEDLMRDIDDNGFTAVAIRSSLTASLNAIDKRLKA